MTREIIAYATEAAWLAAREKDITSTQAAALFNAGAYVKTAYELFMLKSGKAKADDFKENDRTKWGNRLESAIALGMAEDLGLIVEPFKVYVRIPELCMGSSFDFKIVGLADGFTGDETYRDLFRQHGPGVMEVKAVDSLQFRRNWVDDGESIEATPQIEFQVAHQLEVADLNWAVIAPLVGGNTPKPAYRLRDRATGEAIRAKAAEFWKRIGDNNPPEPDFTKDGDTIAQVYRDNDGSFIDLSDNPRLAVLCKQYKRAAVDAKTAEDAKSAAKAEILTIVKAAKSIQYTGGKISAGTNKESYRAYYRDGFTKCTITVTEVAGTDIEATVPPYRNLRITEDA
jgi:hypothetical protein